MTVSQPLPPTINYSLKYLLVLGTLVGPPRAHSIWRKRGDSKYMHKICIMKNLHFPWLFYDSLRLCNAGPEEKRKHGTWSRTFRARSKYYHVLGISKPRSVIIIISVTSAQFGTYWDINKRQRLGKHYVMSQKLDGASALSRSSSLGSSWRHPPLSLCC